MRSMFRAIPAIALTLPLAACGYSLEGTVDGAEFGDVMTAFFRDETPEGSALRQYRLVLTNYEGGCETYDSYILNQAAPVGEGPFAAVDVLFQLFDPVEATTYPILPQGEFLPDPHSPPETVNGRYYAYPDTEWISHNATGGSLTFENDDTTALQGTISIIFDEGTLEGGFEAVPCP